MTLYLQILWDKRFLDLTASLCKVKTILSTFPSQTVCLNNIWANVQVIGMCAHHILWSACAFAMDALWVTKGQTFREAENQILGSDRFVSLMYAHANLCWIPAPLMKHPNFIKQNEIINQCRLLITGLKFWVPGRKLIFLLLNQNLGCGYSKELSQWDGSFEHSKHTFKLMDKKISAILR